MWIRRRQLKRNAVFLIFALMFAMFAACSGKDTQKKYEAEEVEVHGGRAMSEESGFSGKGYVSFGSHINGYVELPFSVSQDGVYAVRITYAAQSKNDWSGVRVEYDDGKYLCSQRLPESESFSQVLVNAPLELAKGQHKLKIIALNRGWLFDCMEVIPATEEIIASITPSKNPVSKNASAATRKLYDYLLSVRGKGIISGQQISSMAEIDVIEEMTGKTPAILGLDMMDYSPSRVERGARGNSVRRAKAWVKKGGIVTFCWHWNAPTQLVDEDRPEMRWYDGFRTKATKFDFSKAIKDKNSEEYRLIIRDIDAIAVQLKSLQDSDVPVLWRPLHEASGGWFWWGSKGAENYKSLYKILFDRLENYHKLTNLIWVWNAQNPEWYPGDEYVDVVSYDTYPPKRSYGTFHDELQAVQSASTKPKLCALSENGTLPDITRLAAEKSVWSWFCTWCGEFIERGGSYSDEYTDADSLKKFYASEYLISLDDLRLGGE